MKQKTVRFTKKAVEQYLDDNIRYWRNARGSENTRVMRAIFYIDAFQSVRVSLFGKVLKRE